MRAGRLSDWITIQERTLTTLASGEKQETWADRFHYPAEARRLSETVAQFIIRYVEGITPVTHRIIYWGARWALVDVIPDRKRTMLTLTSDFSSLVEATHLQSTEREFIDTEAVIRPPA